MQYHSEKSRGLLLSLCCMLLLLLWYYSITSKDSCSSLFNTRTNKTKLLIFNSCSKFSKKVFFYTFYETEIDIGKYVVTEMFRINWHPDSTKYKHSLLLKRFVQIKNCSLCFYLFQYKEQQLFNFFLCGAFCKTKISYNVITSGKC